MSDLRGGARLSGSGVDYELPFLPPYDWESILQFLAVRTLAGVEAVFPNAYRRTIELRGSHGVIEVRKGSGDFLSVTIWYPDTRCHPEILHRIALLFDVGTDPAPLGRLLSADPLLEPLVRQRPGLRVPGGWDAFEIAVRAIAGQQVSLKAGCALTERVARLFGTPLCMGGEAPSGVWQLFPAPHSLAQRDLYEIGMPWARLAALRTLANASAADPEFLMPGLHTVRRLRSLPGVGQWTAQYIAMRALRDPDAFPVGDVVLARILSFPLPAKRLTVAQMIQRANGWRPWRAYAVLHLWTAESAAGEKKSTAAGSGG